MVTTKTIELFELDKIVFENLVCFEKELANPQIMKKEMDQLIRRLGKHKIQHTNRVITKVIQHHKERKTILMQIMVPIAAANDIDFFLADYDVEYFFIEEYMLKESIKASIPNDMNEFKRAVNAFVHYANVNDVNDLDFKNNHIIEIAKVDMHGTILGFDLHMEK